MSKTMTDPTILPALQSIYEVIRVDGQQIVLFENGTYMLLTPDQSVDEITKSIGSFDSRKMANLTLHYFTNHDILLFMQPDYPAIGVLKPFKKNMKINLNVEKNRAIQCIKADLTKKRVLVDSRETDLSDLIPAMYFVVNTTLKMGKGKIAAQVGHAVETLVEDLLKKPNQDYVNWKNSLRRKVVLKASEEEIQGFLDEASRAVKKGEEKIDNESFITVRDAGLTQVEPGSLTVLGFVPMEGRTRPEFLKNLKLL